LKSISKCPMTSSALLVSAASLQIDMPLAPGAS
jgi:hypothetical protein